MRSYGKKKKSSPSGKSSRHKSPARKRSPRNADAEDKDEFNEKGEIMKWNCNNQDGRELKIYVKNGCTTGLTANPLQEKYPQLNKYAYHTFNSALTNARKAFNTQVRNRAKGLCEY